MDEKSGRELTFPIIRNDAREYWKTNCGDGWVRGGSGGRAGERAGRQTCKHTKDFQLSPDQQLMLYTIGRSTV
jgi:hypothetical protein